MKKTILIFLSILAFIILISEPEYFTLLNIILKVISLLWLLLIFKANNYFSKGE